MAHKEAIDVNLDIFKPRPHQIPALDAIENKGYKRILLVWSRRGGKDILCWNLIIRQSLLRVGNYFYVFPNKEQARNAIWDSLTNDGQKFIDFIPSDLIDKIHNVRMSITLVNGSNIQLMGAKTYNSMTGTNPKGIVFSEYAQSDPRALQYTIPIVNGNDGFIVLQSTPRGKNDFYKFYNIGLNNPDEWYVEKRSVDDIGHIDKDRIEKDIEYGVMSRDLVEQEYYCSFSLGVSGSYYAYYLDKMEIEERITDVPWDPSYPVHTAWDLGMDDYTAIIFFQVIGQKVCILEAFQDHDHGLEYYAKYINNKEYQYGYHFLPHDVEVREQGTGYSRKEKLRRLGIRANVVKKLPIADGIEAVRTMLPRTWINRDTCKDLLLSLEHYRKEYNEEKQIYLDRPRHDMYCFTGDMLVTTSTGQKPIKDIRKGEMVKTPFGYRKVLQTHERYTNQLVDLQVGNTEITTTKEHDIFTQRGLVKSSSLRYSDVLEYDSLLSGYLWKKIYGFSLKGLGLNGFKKSYLSLKTKNTQCLMGTFIDGIKTTIKGQKQEEIATPHYTGLYGLITMALYPIHITYIILMETLITMTSVTYSVLKQVSTLDCIIHCQTVGHNLKNVKSIFDLSANKQKSGIEVKKDESGIESMLKKAFPPAREQNTKRPAKYVQSNITGSRHGKNTAVTSAKQKIGLHIKKISFGAIALFVKVHSFVINTLLKKHAVRNVQSYQCDTPKKVYDLTVEHDNCYYVNNYLVSNSDMADALRYLAISYRSTHQRMTQEDMDQLRREALQKHGSYDGMPAVFQNPTYR